MESILIVDDDATFCLMLKTFLEKKSFLVATSFSSVEAKKMVSTKFYDIVLTDLRMPDVCGMELISYIKQEVPETEVLMMTGYASVSNAVKSIKLGAFNFISKPFGPDEVLDMIEDALSHRKGNEKQKNEILPATISVSKFYHGKGKLSQQLLNYIELTAPTFMSVLIVGESGTGKEMVAKMIHEKSDRAKNPFIAVDCGSISKTLALSEFFGHDKGAFTGAVSDKVGCFEAANGGVLFLDEVGNLNYSTQVVLLRALQERKIKPVGSNREVAVDVRILAATNEDLKESVQIGSFREDLYHRLNEFQINVPALRERKSDLMHFATFFLDSANTKLGKSIKGFDECATYVLNRYTWPGNLREMKNTIQRAVLLSKKDVITLDELPSSFYENIQDCCGVPFEGEDEKIKRALHITNNNKSKAARLLNIDRKTLYRKMKIYNI
ncbi:sigma-54-dependent Fis family transcriptional regulator [Labilibaculum filiforme]|uniref:Sigma-54-dependent Fis family transcriptional regulator n=1 Tax=Labilibaculum filiforme TaxID=1940526 RepID=A0A2N3I4D5_9BACT|nr:sigma-54 dependent transcriptional regulator [Labilibaculum filiforme]PKQ65113.1 sigma-54-dependent Fis family transcriptional regulator [Labilibaculum filiforme]